MKTSASPSPSTGAEGPEGTTHERLVATGVAQEVQADTWRSAFPSLSPELLAGFERRARAQDAAATPPPVDPEQSLSDGWALAAIASLTEKLRQAEVLVASKLLALEAVRRARALLPKPWGWAMRLFIIVVVLGGTLLSVYQLGELLAPSLDVFVLRSVLTAIYEDEVAQVSFEQARYLAWGAAGALLLWQSLVVLISWGRVSRAIKMVFFLSDALFAVAFAMVRLGTEATYQSLSMSVFELSLVVLFSAALTAISRRLAQDQDLAERYRPADAEVKRALEACGEALGRESELKRELTSRQGEIARREDVLRRHPAVQELMAATAVTEHLVTLSELIGKMIPSDLTEKFLAELPDHLRQVYGARQIRR